MPTTFTTQQRRVSAAALVELAGEESNYEWPEGVMMLLLAAASLVVVNTKHGVGQDVFMTGARVARNEMKEKGLQ